MSVLTYSNFVNEATIKQLEVGTKVLFTGKFTLGGWTPVDLAGKTGVVSKIKNWNYGGLEFIEFQLDEPMKNPNVKKNRIQLNGNQLRNIKVLGDDTLELWNKEKGEKQPN